MKPSSAVRLVPVALVLWANSVAAGAADVTPTVLLSEPLDLFPPDSEAALVRETEADELLVRFKPGADGPGLARGRRLAVRRLLRSDASFAVLKAESVAAAREQLRALRGHPQIEAVFLNRRSQNRPRAFVPNDPYFQVANPPGFPGQWHLRRLSYWGTDVNIAGAWNRDLTGRGVVIGICDDGVDMGHPDLSLVGDANFHRDFEQNDNDPNPRYVDDNHGTAVAGVAAARGGNRRGVTGAAPLAQLAALRVLGDEATDADFVDAVLYYSSGPNQRIQVKNHSYGPTAPFRPSAAERYALKVSAGAGTIHVIAAGNERGKPKEDANKDLFANSPDALAVAALASSGRYASYSCFGANVFVTAPSGSRRVGEYGHDRYTGIVTTDRRGPHGYNNQGSPDNPFADLDYTGDFGGTSSAAPLVAGIMALGVQANPKLNVRLAKHVLVKTCCIVDWPDATESSDGGWRTNKAGIYFNPNYGFGLIDASAFTAVAQRYEGVTPLAIAGHPTPVWLNVPIPDGGSTSVAFTVPTNTPVEEVEIYLSIDHPVRGQLEAEVTSAAGTTRRLFRRAASGTVADRSADGLDWVFTCNGFWGENPSGTWQVRVFDTVPDGVAGTWRCYRAQVRMGQVFPIRRPTITGFDPPWGPWGTRITIRGTDFLGATNVQVGGVSVPFEVESAKRIMATVGWPCHDGPVSVLTPDGDATSEEEFHVTWEPVIYDFCPMSAGEGGTLVIHGMNLAETISVRIGDQWASFRVESDSRLIATVPSGVTEGPVEVETPFGWAASRISFQPTTGPWISEFHPTEGEPGTVVTISGGGFEDVREVAFGGVSTAFGVEGNQITAPVPEGAASGLISVTAGTPEGLRTALSCAGFEVLRRPEITRLLRDRGRTNDMIAILGTNLGGAFWRSGVRFNGTNARWFGVEADTQIRAVLPSGLAPGDVVVTVQTRAGTNDRAPNFVLLGNPPANDNFATPEPLAGPSGRFVNPVSTAGATKEPHEPAHAGCVGGKSIWFEWTAPDDGVWAFDTEDSSFDTVLAVYTGNALNALVPVDADDDGALDSCSRVVFAASRNRTYRLAVDGFNPDDANTRVAAGPVTLSWQQLTNPPQITSFNPAAGPIGTSVAIRGSHFIGTTSVLFGGVAATEFWVFSDALIRATVPLYARTGPITVNNRHGPFITAADFIVLRPPNDFFTDAVELTGPSGFTTGSTVNATREACEPDHADKPGGHSIWYRWTAPTTSTYTLHTQGSDFDTLLAVYTGNSICPLSPVASNDNASPAVTWSSVTFNTGAGTVYRIAVDGFTNATGVVRLHWAETPGRPAITGFAPASGAPGTWITISGINFFNVALVTFGGMTADAFTVLSSTSIAACVPVGAQSGAIEVITSAGTAWSGEPFVVLQGPPGDGFANARLISGAAGIVQATNIHATKEPGEPDHAGNAGGRSVWFRWTAPSNGVWQLSTAGSSFDTLLAVYTGPGLTNLTLVAANDDAPGGMASVLTFQAVAGTTYWIAVDGSDGASGQVVLTLGPLTSLQTLVLYATGFETNEGYSFYPPPRTLAGQNGWLANGDRGNGLTTGAIPDSGVQAWIGSQWPVGIGSTLWLWRPVNYAPPAGAKARLEFAVDMRLPSSWRLLDGFGWGVFNTNGDWLFQLSFWHSDHRIYYALDDGAGWVDSGWWCEYNRTYHLAVAMDLVRNRWTARLDSDILVENQPITTRGAPLNLGYIGACWTPQDTNYPGDNFMAFDNYRISATLQFPPALWLEPESQTVAAGTDVRFGVVATGEEPLAYQWQFNGAALPGATAPLLTLYNVTKAAAGHYAVVVSNAIGAVTSAVAELRVRVPQRLAAPVLLAGNRVQLVFGDCDGDPLTPADLRRFEVQASSVLPATNWVTLTNPLVLTNGLVLFVDEMAPGQPCRFYRVVER